MERFYVPLLAACILLTFLCSPQNVESVERSSNLISSFPTFVFFSNATSQENFTDFGSGWNFTATTFEVKSQQNFTEFTDIKLCKASLGSTTQISATVVIYGLPTGWEAGAPVPSDSVTKYILEPLLASCVDVDVVFCLEPTTESSFIPVIYRKTISSWGNLKVFTDFFSCAGKFDRQVRCYNNAAARRVATGLLLPDFWILLRSDLIFFSPLPSLYSLPRNAISARARMAHLYEGLTTDHFAWLFSDNTCVDYCPQPCPTFVRRFFMADDQLGIVPGSIASLYFDTISNLSLEQITVAADAPPCANLTWPAGTYRVTSEQYLFTCPLLAKGLKFAPLQLAARINALSRKSHDFWWPQHIPLVPPIIKNCT